MVHSRRETVAGAAAGLQAAGEGLNIGAAARGQPQGAGPAPGGELAQVQCAGLAGQAAVPARNPAIASRPASVEAGWIVASAVERVAVVIRHLPAGLRPGRLGQLRAPAIEPNPNVGRIGQSRDATDSGT
jgi:hypothetical protein